MPSRRVKESCVPCRQRKSRCDGNVPCSPCTIRDERASCHFTSGYKRRNAAALHRGSTASAGPSTTPRSTISTSQRSKRRRRQPSSGSSPGAYDHGVQDNVVDARPEDRENWLQFSERLPSKHCCEVLVEFLLQECDWMWPCRDIPQLWKRVIATQSCSKIENGILCISLAFPAYILSTSGSTLYRLDVDVSRIHQDMYKLGESFAPDVPDSLDDVELLVALFQCLIPSGEAHEKTSYITNAVTYMSSAGLFDEGSDTWDQLERKEKDRVRSLAWQILESARWSGLSMPSDPLEGITVNLARPSPLQALGSPVRLDLPADNTRTPCRLFRVRTDIEMQRTRAYLDMSSEMSKLLPRLRKYVHMLNDAHSDESAVADTCNQIYQEVCFWRDVRLPSSDFAPIPVEKIDAADPFSCRDAAQRLVLQNMLAFFTSLLLRHWYAISSLDKAETAPDPYRFGQCCVDNANRSISSISLIKGLKQARLVPFISSYAMANLFSSAMVFLVEILRAARRYDSVTANENIRNLPEWPWESGLKTRRTKKQKGQAWKDTPDFSAFTPRLAPSLLAEPKIKQCVDNILLVRETLLLLDDSFIGMAICFRLSGLITAYGLDPHSDHPTSSSNRSETHLQQVSLDNATTGSTLGHTGDVSGDLHTNTTHGAEDEFAAIFGTALPAVESQAVPMGNDFWDEILRSFAT